MNLARFIPTCVGNTLSSPKRNSGFSVHPHVRGEHWSSHRHCPNAAGSSPRAWGTLSWRQFSAEHHRFIPTCVGNTACRLPVLRCHPVHPHVRGEHAPTATMNSLDDGSSPRAWGTPRDPFVGQPAQRFIPTCVGNTVATQGRISLSSVHPHVRGEHHPPSAGLSFCAGSSPRAWGTQIVKGVIEAESRFIPTCVGNTISGGRRKSC